jgi:hypothetical protein
MATVVNFHGKNYIEPGSYAATVYNPTSVVNVAEFGNVMIIDTGLSLATVNGVNTEFAGGSGVNGQLAKGLKSVYQFENYEDFLSFIGGGLVGDIANKIFTPIDGVLGAPKLYYVRAATTEAAKIELTISSGNKLTLTCKNEGLCGNGVEVDSVLKVGYSAQIVAGEANGTFKLVVYKGSFMGEDSYGEPYGAYSLADAKPNLIAESGDYTTLQQLYDWASSNKQMLAHFNVEMDGSGATALAAVNKTLASGGTTSYLNSGEYDAVLEAIAEMDITFFLCTNMNADSGAAINSNTNGKLFTHIKNTAKFTSHMFVPGGEEDDDLFGESNCSEATAKYYDSDQVVVVHGAPIVTRKDQNGTKQLHAIYLTAAIMGLNAGMAPQTPLTFKRVGYGAFAYDLKRRERERALQAGILHTRNVSGYWCVNQGVTTLQNNKKTIADDGQTFELSISLIKAQLNKELITDGQLRFTGLTVAQASPESVKNFTETKLASFVASPGNDNLLISWRNVKVTAKNSDYFITYDFVPNVPVNKTFFVGNILDFVLSV